MKPYLTIAALAGIAGIAACAEAPSDPTSSDRAFSEPEASATQTATQQVQASQPVSTPSVAETPEPDVTPMAAVCSPQEIPIFSCKVQGGKQLSVCGQAAGAGGGPVDGGAQYRFCSENNAELILDGGTWASVPYSGGGEAQIKFDSGDTSYIVFSRVVRTNFKAGEPNNPAFTDGVVILKGGKQIGQQVCDDPNLRPIDYNKAEELLEQANRLFTQVE